MFWYRRIWSRKKVSVSENLDSIDIDVLFWRRRKRRKTFEKENIFFLEENQRRKRRKIFGEDLSRILRSLGFGFGLETFANFWRVSVSVSENLVSEKILGFGFGEFSLGKKVSVSVSENLVSGKKSRFWFRKIWYWKKSLGICFGQNFGIAIQCFTTHKTSKNSREALQIRRKTNIYVMRSVNEH